MHNKTSDTTLADQARAWMTEHWDPEATLGEWWSALAGSGFAVPSWPEAWCGFGASGAEAAAIRAVFQELGVPGPPVGLGIMLAGPTLLAHGSDDQRARYLSSIVDGTTMWCQLFSEPGAGSDLAGLATTATRDGADWRITGQKVWTSNGQLADKGMLLARTDPASRGREGITWFVMDQPQIEVRPLREMTGRALFTEVFLDGPLARQADVVGGIGKGWPLARTTLASERAGLAEGAAVGSTPGPKAGMLQQRCGDVSDRLRAPRRRSGTAAAMRGRAFEAILAAARRTGAAEHPVVRQDLARLFTLEKLAELGGRGNAANLSKLRQGAIVRHASDLAMRILGSEGMLLVGDYDDISFLSELVLSGPSVSIYGGTDEIQRNLVAERALGLPKEHL
jgi:alkylation response protein AidB-like acyl-CoA dehydrogenase